MKGLKSGWRTSEFWLAVATMAGGLYLGLGNMIPDALMAQIIMVSGSVYTIARAVVKFTPSKADDDLLDKIVDAFDKKSKSK